MFETFQKNVFLGGETHIFGDMSEMKRAKYQTSIGCKQGAISCATARPPVAASTGALTLAGSPSIHAIVAKSILSRFTRFWMYRFQPFMVMNGYFMIMMLAQGYQH